MKRITSLILCIAILLACGTLFTACKDNLAPGLYDADDNLVVSWSELENTYGMRTSSDSSYEKLYLSEILSSNRNLSKGTKLVIKHWKIDEYIFSNCTTLTSIILPKDPQLYDGAFAGCTSLTSITIPCVVHTLRVKVCLKAVQASQA